ncbi:MAG: winged helix-turn-helix domain-containing protein [Acidobacteriota bacterium]|nr:winged helix-turn-helix domain-containing protein [Acidobacteriota bacterium]
MSNKTYFRFGSFRLYPGEHQLFREDTAIPLAPKAFDILVYLVSHGGSLVHREELMQAVWPDSFVEETNLNVNISLLRKTLGSLPNGEPLIETVPRKGYRFNSPVSEEEDSGSIMKATQHGNVPEIQLSPEVGAAAMAAAATAIAPEPSPAATAIASPRAIPATKASLSRIALLCVILLGLGAAAFFIASRLRSHSNTVSASTRSIAVLPFHGLNPNLGDEYLGLGMTDALITRLSNLHKIIVRPVGTVKKYATSDDPLSAGKELAVDSVLDGTIQHSGDRTRVTVRLLRVSDGEELWGSEFDEKLTDMFAIEDSISQKVAGALALNLSGDEQRRLARPFTASNDAYQLYMKGRFFWNKRTVEGVKKSLEYFQQAIAADPGYAVAYTGLADAYIMAGSYGYSIMPPREAMPKAEAAVQKALSIDNSLAEAHSSLAYIKFTYDWDWAGAEQEFRQAIALNPLYDTAHHWYSHELMALGRQDEAMAEARRALEISPSDTVINEHMGWTWLMMRNYDQAVQAAHKALEMDPDFVLAHRVTALAYMYEGNNQKAIEEFQKAVDLTHGDPVARAYLARGYAVAGPREQAQQIINDLEKLAKIQYMPNTELAADYAALGDSQQALQWLERSYEERASALPYLKVDRAYDSLRADPRFADLLHRLNLQ